MGLLQKALTTQTAAFGITNCGSFYDKLRQLLYYKTGQFLLQNVGAGQLYYKIRQLLQNMTFITKRTITKLTWNNFSVQSRKKGFFSYHFPENSNKLSTNKHFKKKLLVSRFNEKVLKYPQSMQTQKLKKHFKLRLLY